VLLGFLTDGWSDRAITAVNAVMAWGACVAHIYAASKTSRRLRLMFVTIGSLALFYSFAYWWLFFNPDRVEEWSNMLRPISIFAWAIAWMIEPLVIIRYMQGQGRWVVRAAEHEAAKARVILDKADLQ